jgi:hypothetical protein
MKKKNETMEFILNGTSKKMELKSEPISTISFDEDIFMTAGPRNGTGPHGRGLGPGKGKGCKIERR